MATDDDAALLSAARSGDPAAISALVARHQGAVFRFGLRMCKNPEDAKDVVQDTLLSMAKGVRDFRGASSLSTWLFTIARSHCLKKRRKRKGAPAPADLGGEAELATLADGAHPPDEALARRQTEHAIERAIAGLAPMYREVLLLRDVEGLTAPEVAEVLGVGVAAVKSRLHRARLALRDVLAEHVDEGGAPTDRCPDILALYSRHLEGEISQAVCAEMERHLAGCPRCQRACGALKSRLAICRTLPSPAVPPELQASIREGLIGVLPNAVSPLPTRRR